MTLEMTDEEFEALEEWLADYCERVSAENVRRDVYDFRQKFGMR